MRTLILTLGLALSSAAMAHPNDGAPGSCPGPGNSCAGGKGNDQNKGGAGGTCPGAGNRCDGGDAGASPGGKGGKCGGVGNTCTGGDG